MSPAPRVPQGGGVPGSSGRGSMELCRGQDHGKAPSTWFRLRLRRCGCGQGTGAAEAAGTGEAAGDTRGLLAGTAGSPHSLLESRTQVGIDVVGGCDPGRQVDPRSTMSTTCPAAARNGRLDAP